MKMKSSKIKCKYLVAAQTYSGVHVYASILISTFVSDLKCLIYIFSFILLLFTCLYLF